MEFFNYSIPMFWAYILSSISVSKYLVPCLRVNFMYYALGIVWVIYMWYVLCAISLEYILGLVSRVHFGPMPEGYIICPTSRVFLGHMSEAIFYVPF